MTKNYLIVGGSSGVGLALTTMLSESDHQVEVWSRSAESLGSLNGVRHKFFDALQDDMPQLDFESLDGLAYCPGSINLKPFHRLKQEDFQNDFEINVMGAVKVAQTVLPALKKAEHASVLFFSTVAVQQGMSFHTSVAVSKGALEGLTKSLAAELAPKIRVNCIAPSITDTPLASKILSSEEKKQVSAKRHPLDRVGQPQDIASMASFLLSDAAGWITGQVIGVDGGLSAIKSL